ncbi:MAG: hypothetical protein SGARI_003333, partial [Bacillariaceae sp.]
MLPSLKKTIGNETSDNNDNGDDVNIGNRNSDVVVHYSDFRIALYYIYLSVDDVTQQVLFHREMCERLGLTGRIRVSAEGINGVLSGPLLQLEEYEAQFQEAIRELQKGSGKTNDNDNNTAYPHQLDIKYCHLREDLPVSEQLFDSLTVKETKTVISLFDAVAPPEGSDKKKRHQPNRYQRKRERKRNAKRTDQRGQEQEYCSNKPNEVVPSTSNDTAVQTDSSAALLDVQSLHMAVMKQPLQPSTHLSASDWNQKLDQVHHSEDALLLDARNCYESRVGHFQHPTTPTLLTNTRKYSDLVSVLASNPHLQEDKRKQVFMYCTGGVRCERVSMLVKELYPEKEVFQLKGGIQTYLQECKEGDQTGTAAGSGSNDKEQSEQYFVGKNF